MARYSRQCTISMFHCLEKMSVHRSGAELGDYDIPGMFRFCRPKIEKGKHFIFAFFVLISSFWHCYVRLPGSGETIISICLGYKLFAIVPTVWHVRWFSSHNNPFQLILWISFRSSLAEKNFRPIKSDAQRKYLICFLTNSARHTSFSASKAEHLHNIYKI